MTLWVRLTTWLYDASRARADDERGDVPGWVLVSVMTITVGMGLFAVARPMLTDMLRSALNSVK
ncbi:MAG TPA: hypothetical protein VN088_00415 [Nocardioides sp.]|nr:hypothetical protein [Nocardioides sp.]